MNYIVKYPGSAFVYVSVLIACVLFAYLGSRNKNRKKKFNIWILMIIILLSIFAGIRGETVGIDVAHYIIKHIEPIRDGYFFKVNQPIGYKVLVWIVYQFTEQTYFVFLLFSFITNVLIIMRLWDFRNKASFPLMVFFYYCYYYLISFNVFRQFLAIAIVFFMTRYIERKEYVKFAIIIAVAMSIHSSAILGFILIPIDILVNDTKVKERKLKKIMMYVSPILIVVAGGVIYRYFDYDHYLVLYSRYSSGGLGFMTPTKIFVSLMMYRVIKRDIKKRKNELIKFKELNSIYIIYLIGLALSLLVIISSFADRFAWYFLAWEPVFMSIKIRKNDVKFLFRGIYVIFAIYTLYISLNSSGQGIMPYVTFWH